MIQELVGSSILVGEAKISFNGAPHHPLPQASTTPTHDTSNTTTTNTTNSPSSTLENQNKNNNNLRCPRCDSANTKFCYYNNYNLTQPRHFCKTCRRYWTKGGALRNVPIGGGCRKNKSSSGKLLKTVSVPVGFDYELPPNSSSSHLLSLLRSQNPNPSRNPISSHVKEEKASPSPNHLIMSSTQPLVSSTGAHLGHQLLPSLGLCTSSMWRSNNLQNPSQQNFNDQNSGMQQVYQRLIRSSATASYHSDQRSPPVMLSNAASNSSYTDLGYGWNAPFSWSDLSTTNGAYP